MTSTLVRDRLQERWHLQTVSAGLRIALADGDDTRARRAAVELMDSGITPVLVTGEGGDVPSGVEVLNPLDAGSAIAGVLDATIERTARKKPLSAADRDQILGDPVMVAAAAVQAGLADGCVAGASRPTADVLRAALRVIGIRPEGSLVSSMFLMVFPDGRAFGYGDCAVVPEPNAVELADIAIQTAETFAALTGEDPAVAMLSFSTKGSAEHPSIDVVREATAIAVAHRPNLAIDGELQFDAATMPLIAESKAPGSPVAGRANVFIFPNLAAGNIAYKMTERLGGAAAFGPVLQGLAAPMNDLSRGCSASDIRNVSIMTGVQALARREDPIPGGD